MKEIDWKMVKQDQCFVEKLKGYEINFCATWGLFSPSKIDDGTRLLIEKMKVEESDVVLDIGCGYGPIGIVAAKMANKGKVYMIDKDFVAIEYAEKNMQLNQVRNGKTYLSNMLDRVPTDVVFDVVTTNLPAKVNKELIWIMMVEAKKRMRKGAKFYIVVIAGLKEFIKRNFKYFFGNCKNLGFKKGYGLFMAVKEQD